MHFAQFVEKQRLNAINFSKNVNCVYYHENTRLHERLRSSANVEPFRPRRFAGIPRRHMENSVMYFVYHQNKAPHLLDDAPPYYKLTVVTEGSIQYFCDGEEIILSAGSCLFTKPAQKRYRPAQSAPASYYSLNITLGEKLGYDIARCFRYDDSKSIIYLLNMIGEYFYSNEERRAEMVENLLRALLIECERASHNAASNAYITAAKDYITKNSGRSITVGDIAFHIGLSPSYTAALFRSAVGCSIGDYIDKIRLNAAIGMLGGGYTPSQIAQRLGYSDAYSFSRWFYRVTGVRPSKYK